MIPLRRGVAPEFWPAGSVAEAVRLMHIAQAPLPSDEPILAAHAKSMEARDAIFTVRQLSYPIRVGPVALWTALKQATVEESAAAASVAARRNGEPWTADSIDRLAPNRRHSVASPDSGPPQTKDFQPHSPKRFAE